MARLPNRPTWDQLYATASSQDGYFTAKQAGAAGYSPQLTQKHIQGGRIERVGRGVYRLVHYPATALADLVTIWLWSAHAGVFSHETALALYELSDVLPARVQLTLPTAWARRRLRVPAGVVIHHADVPEIDRSWFGPVPVTTVRRTLNDCARDHLSPEHLQVAARQAIRRGMVRPSELADVERELAPYGGLAP